MASILSTAPGWCPVPVLPLDIVGRPSSTHACSGPDCFPDLRVSDHQEPPPLHISAARGRNARLKDLAGEAAAGRIKYLLQGEIDARNRGYNPCSTEIWRAWEYWANKAGCGHMLTRPDDERTRALGN